ncbi:MAG: hypothetical protein R3316_10720 [Rhodovibrionaceae bacterium]|nr:hypothetical protein [Rhodovibrionaceae bacterium]
MSDPLKPLGDAARTYINESPKEGRQNQEFNELLEQLAGPLERREVTPGQAEVLAVEMREIALAQLSGQGAQTYDLAVQMRDLADTAEYFAMSAGQSPDPSLRAVPGYDLPSEESERAGELYDTGRFRLETTQTSGSLKVYDKATGAEVAVQFLASEEEAGTARMLVKTDAKVAGLSTFASIQGDYPLTLELPDGGRILLQESGAFRIAKDGRSVNPAPGAEGQISENAQVPESNGPEWLSSVVTWEGIQLLMELGYQGNTTVKEIHVGIRLNESLQDGDGDSA